MTATICEAYDDKTPADRAAKTAQHNDCRAGVEALVTRLTQFPIDPKQLIRRFNTELSRKSCNIGHNRELTRGLVYLHTVAAEMLKANGGAKARFLKLADQAERAIPPKPQ